VDRSLYIARRSLSLPVTMSQVRASSNYKPSKNRAVTNCSHTQPRESTQIVGSRRPRTVGMAMSGPSAGLGYVHLHVVVCELGAEGGRRRDIRDQAVEVAQVADAERSDAPDLGGIGGHDR